MALKKIVLDQARNVQLSVDENIHEKYRNKIDERVRVQICKSHNKFEEINERRTIAIVKVAKYIWHKIKNVFS